TASGTGCLAGSVPQVLVRSCRCARAPPRPHGPVNLNEEAGKGEKMTDHVQYAPGPASGAEVRKDGEKWTLILVRELRHAPATVWQALTDPAHLCGWAPFDADRSLARAGPGELLRGRGRRGVGAWPRGGRRSSRRSGRRRRRSPRPP